MRLLLRAGTVVLALLFLGCGTRDLRQEGDEPAGRSWSQVSRTEDQNERVREIVSERDEGTDSEIRAELRRP